jgi:hypothetical protein
LNLKARYIANGWRGQRVTRRILILILAVSVAGCTSVRSHFAFLWHRSPHAAEQAQTAQASAQPAPKPADGLWAILDPGCPKPSVANFTNWPNCASPFWISRDSAVVVRSREAHRGQAPAESYRTDYQIAAGDPVIAQVGNARDGYVFLALTELARDDQGRLVSATGAAFACPQPGGGAIALRPNLNGCEAESPDDVRRAAEETLQDHAALTRVAWIAPGAP